MEGSRTFSACKHSPRNGSWGILHSLCGKEESFPTDFLHLWRQWRAWSNTSESIKFLFFSNHFTFGKNCIFMRLHSPVGTRWQLSFPGNQEINQAAKLRGLRCEILLTFQKVVLSESYFFFKWELFLKRKFFLSLALSPSLLFLDFSPLPPFLPAFLKWVLPTIPLLLLICSG